MTGWRLPSSWEHRPSPNQNGRGAHRISAILLHADASARVESSLDWITRRESKVSYHVLIGRNGKTWCLVHPEARAWHAGVSSLDGVADCNAYSVGVCLSNRNDGVEKYPLSQLGAAADVCATLCLQYSIPVERITTHAAVALPPGRKTDPVGLDLTAFRTMVRARLGAAPLGGL